VFEPPGGWPRVARQIADPGATHDHIAPLTGEGGYWRVDKGATILGRSVYPVYPVYLCVPDLVKRGIHRLRRVSQLPLGCSEG
jgi:hypothetical protein